MTISFLSVGTMAVVQNATLTVAPPAASSYVAGDLLLLLVGYRSDDGGVSIPSGWVELVAWDDFHRILAKIATSSSEASVAITRSPVGSTAEPLQGQMAAFRSTVGWRPDLVNMVSGFKETVAEDDDNATPAHTVTGVANQLAITTGHRFGSYTAMTTPPTDTTLIGHGFTTNGNGAGLMWARQIVTTGDVIAASRFNLDGGSVRTAYSALFVIAEGGIVPGSASDMMAFF